jgi:hypothetical protein
VIRWPPARPFRRLHLVNLTLNIRAFWLLSLLGALAASGAAAQDPLEIVRRPAASREALNEARSQLQLYASSPAYGEVLRSRARGGVAAIERRLAQGDFGVGDRIMLRVEGQAQLTDTFTVAAGRRLLLPGMRPLDLTGVLRTELEPHLVREIGLVARVAQIRAAPLMRVGVFGNVFRQGYYSVPADMLVEAVIMNAGGAQGEVNQTGLRIQRNEETIWEGAELYAAMEQGRTLEGLGLRDGDAIVLPRILPPNWEVTLRSVGYALALPASIFATIALFR